MGERKSVVTTTVSRGGSCRPRVVPKAHLAGIEVEVVAWEPVLAAALCRLLASPPKQFHIFRRVVSFFLQQGPELLLWSDSARLGTARTNADAFPLATTFMCLRTQATDGRTGGGSPLETTLGWLLLELHLAGGYTSEVLALATKLRGLSSARDGNQLLRTVAECNGLLHLVLKLEALHSKGAPSKTSRGTSLTGHQQFDGLWVDSLGGICRDLLVGRTPDATLPDGEPLSANLDSLESAPLNPTESALESEPDDGATHADDSPLPGEGPSAVFRRAVTGTVRELYRRSSPSLFQDPEGIAPSFLLEKQRIHLINEVKRANAESDLPRLEQCFIHLLAIESGLTDREAKSALFANAAMQDIVAIDLKAHALRRPEVRPPKAWTPSEATEIWLPTGGDVLFPLSNATVLVGSQLLAARQALQSDLGSWLIGSGTGQPVHSAFKATNLVAGLTPFSYRRRIAAGLVENLGLDAAQISFGDSFGTNIAPTYYSCFSAASLAQAIAGHNSSFTGQATPAPECLAAAKHWIGSRARTHMGSFSDAWETHGCLGRAERGRPSREQVLRRWRTQRNALALHLALATSHRPTKALADVRLQDVIPQHALVVLADKRTDPAHLTRVASTGWRFTHALAEHVRLLRQIADGSEWTGIRALAREVLEGTASLFDAPKADGRAESLDVAALFGSLPGTWGARNNLHRHALCQFLARAGVHPELRYFQLGWQVNDAHATSEAAPRAPAELTVALADTIDKWLIEAGWLEGPDAASPGDSPATSQLRDWGESRRLHQADGEAQQRRIRQALRDARKGVRGAVLAQLRRQFESFVPALRLDLSSGPPMLQRTDAGNAEVPIVISGDQMRMLLDPFESAIHLHVAKVELGCVLRKAIKQGTCVSGLPRIQWLVSHRPASKLLRGAGAAVAHTRQLRDALVSAAGQKVDLRIPERLERLAMLAVWTTAAFSPYRSMDAARNIVAGVEGLESSGSEDWLLRIPTGDGHAVISGIPAVLLMRLVGVPGGTAALLAAAKADLSVLGRVVKDLLPTQTHALDAAAACSRMEATLFVAGDIELNGPERLVMEHRLRLATVTAQRAASAYDGMTVKAIEPDTEDASEEESDSQRSPERNNPNHRPKRAINRLLRLFNPSFDGMIGGVRALPAKKRIQQLRPLVEAHLDAMGKRVGFDLVVLDYVHHLMTEGGPNSAGGMEASTIYKIYHRLAPAMAAIPVDADLSEISDEEMTGAVVVAFSRARRRDSQDVLDDVRRFFKFAVDRYGIAPPDWEMLTAVAGVRIESSDPAVVTDQEAARVVDVLVGDVKMAHDDGVDPVERRFTELKLATGLLLEGSGARPASIRGLTLADIHLDAATSFIHLRSSGKFGDIKSATAKGFIPLEGELWEKHFAWFSGWFESLCQGRSPEELEQIPLFQIPGEILGVRYPLSDVTAALGALLRWSTRHARGRTYWLRKRRVGNRFRKVMHNADATAYSVVRMMRSSGHATVRTPLTSYLGDPLVYVRPDSLSELSSWNRAAALGPLAGVSAAAVDVRWHRSAAKKTGDQPLAANKLRISALLRLPKQAWHVALDGPPPERPAFLKGFSWRAVAVVLSELASEGDDRAVAQVCGVTIARVQEVRALLMALELRTGLRAGPLRGDLHQPRSTTLGRAVERLVRREDPKLLCIANDWVSLCRSWTRDEGFPLLDAGAVAAWRLLLSELGLSPTTKSADGLPPLHLARDSDGEVPYGAWPAIRWALVVAWVGARLQR